MLTELSPSLLAADPARLGDAVSLAVSSGCSELHLDVMDGHFVPNLSFGPHILKGLKAAFPSIRYDVHLMVSDPLFFAGVYAEGGADSITLHVEAAHVSEALLRIRERGLEAGISLRPGTPVESLLPYLPMVNRVLLMTVEPGFGGQKLIPEVLDKAVWLRKRGFAGTLQADGGINGDNAPALVRAGINSLVMGTAFFRNPRPEELCRRIRELGKQ